MKLFKNEKFVKSTIITKLIFVAVVTFLYIPILVDSVVGFSPITLVILPTFYYFFSYGSKLMSRYKNINTYGIAEKILTDDSTSDELILEEYFESG